MESRLSRICDALIEAGWLAALIVTPLFFNTFSSRVFEPDKLHLLRSIALIMAVAWVVQLLDQGLRARPLGLANLWRTIRQTPLVLPTLILVLAYLVSTALSLVPRISFWGSYVRLQGTFSFLSYVAVFGMVLTHLRTRAQVNRLIHTIVLTSLPISIYGLIQHYGLDPLPWGGDVKTRVAGNMGNAIFIAAYLIMAFFLTLERLVRSMIALLKNDKGSTADALRAGAYLFIMAVQLMTILFTLSRGPWLGLFAGFYIFALLGVLLVGRWALTLARAPGWLDRTVRISWFSLIGLSFAAAAFIIVLNIPNGPLQSLRSQRYIGRLSTLAEINSGTNKTNKVRTLIWEGVVDMMLKPHAPLQDPSGWRDPWNAIRPLIGYGPESMWVAYNRFYPPDLAHYEQRNASPDRSHNETFDALVRTGMIGLVAQTFLFCAIFYQALRWLGLIRSRGRRNLFIGMLVGGAIVGIVLPVILDGSLRLSGIGLPFGLMLGFILYLTVDLLLTPTASPENGGLHSLPLAGASIERQLLILGIFSALVAHYIEIHTGIAIASTLTHFWVLAAVMVVVGMGWLDEPVAEALAVPVPTAAAPAAVRAGIQAAASTRRPAKGKRSSRSNEPGPQAAPVQREAQQSRQGEGSLLRPILPYVGIIMMITIVLVWDYVVNQTGAKSAGTLLWQAFTQRIDSVSNRLVSSPMLLVMVLFTWLVGCLLAVAEIAAVASEDRPRRTAGAPVNWVGAALIYLASAVLTFVIYGLFHAGRTIFDGLTGMAVFDRIASGVVTFDLTLLVLLLGTAAAVWLAETRLRPLRWFSAGPALSVLSGVVLTIVALVVITQANVKIVSADTYYKNGLAFEGNGAWESAVLLYHQAARLEPNEDYYYLFLGRALLEYAAGVPKGNATLPANSAQMSQDQVLDLVERALAAHNRDDLLRATHAVLVGAQQLNALNTDHTANLARLNRSWAFVNALGPSDMPSNALLRQVTTTRAKDVDMSKLQQSLADYKHAIALSPQNAQLWNEMASVQYILGDNAGALVSLDRSLALDQAYYQTYVLRGDLLSEMDDNQGALNAYRQALELQPGDLTVLGAVGVYSAQTGDAEGALQAFTAITEQESAALASAEAQLAALNASATQGGGYDRLGQAAKNRRDSLQASINSHRAQLHLAYRNRALVLRDMERLPEALAAARSALEMANDSQKPTVEQLIAELQKRMTG